jgi:tetratricopeptide (TPR) repeat protein
MIIVSNHKKFFFLHIPKSAGRSVAQALARYDDLSSDDVFSNLRLKHETARILRGVDENRFEKYLTFCFVRNPWDRLVSWYFYEKKNQHGFRSVFLRFEDFVHYLDQAWEFIKLQKDYGIYRIMNDPYVIPLPQTDFVLDSKNRLMVDYIGRFENINEDFRQLMDILNLKTELPYVNKTAHANYQEYYTERTRDIVGKCFQKEIDFWSYQYDGENTPVLHRSERFRQLEDARSKLRNGQCEEAEKICQPMLTSSLGYLADKMLAQIYFEQEKYTECVECSLRVVEKDPEDMDGWLLLLKSSSLLDN